jgi:DNA-binding NarL/FixJ family response regulator
VVVVPVPSERPRRPGPKTTLRQVLLIDPQPLFLAALSGLLAEPPLSAQVHVTATSDSLPTWLNTVAIDLVLCDILAEPVPAVEIAMRLSRLSPPIPMILLGDPDEEASLLAAVSWPVSGVFSKDASIDEFLVGVETVLAGHRAFGDRVMGSLLGRLSDGAGFPNGRGPAAHLSPTELDILTRVGHAQSITTIAATRGISHKTVRNHLTNIGRKLQLRGRTEMMLCAARMGLTNQA